MMADLHDTTCNIPKSHFKQTVCLSDWWLVKTDNDSQGRRLAVSGFTSRENQAMRVFSSAPILKRYDVFTIETTDGVCVVFKGFLNKARTAENGFPSDVNKHFVFGFPPYWKEYEEHCMGNESSSIDILGSNLLKSLSPRSETAVQSQQPHANNCEKNLKSKCKIDVKELRRSKRSKSLAVPLPEKSDSVISGSKHNLTRSCIVPEGLEKETYCRGPTVEDPTTLDVRVNCGGNISISAVTDEVVDNLKSKCKIDVKELRRSKRSKSLAVPLPEKSDSVISGSKHNLTMSCIVPEGLEKETYCRGPTVEDLTTLDVHVNCGGNISISAVTDEVVDNSQVDASRGILLPCRLRNRSTDNSKKSNFDKDMSSSHEILSHTESRVRTRSMSISKMNQKNDKKSAGISEGEKIRSNCVSSMGSERVEFTVVDCGSEGRNNRNFSVSELHGHMDKIKSSEFEAGSVKDELVQTTPNYGSDLRNVKAKDGIKKAKIKASRSTFSPAENQEDNVIPRVNNSIDHAQASNMKTRRKLAYESPDRGKDKVCASPQSMSFNRSRSGRLLMPTLEFWRNQRAIYDVDRTITGIEEGLHGEHQRKCIFGKNPSHT